MSGHEVRADHTDYIALLFAGACKPEGLSKFHLSVQSPQGAVYPTFFEFLKSSSAAIERPDGYIND